ncbi:class I SAM-dependent methyltransferase [Streptomyces sp. WMMC897]|uniref:class I SAM-dependent methyltransferase n=1 Tax=Streptomyces sp. WMMC897 TaxID=3014782 RepID=UPI0022B6FA7F|nr:methyltransferase domain-containing protein [Streptomyces sp. WMMC897]MCZ7414540.1 methyltransferase domain-containing protein [Streptomyces sp. WMMC897]
MTVAENVEAAAPQSGVDYVFDPTWDQETERLRTNEALWDAGTIERLERLGVGEGWSALEIGAGSGSVAHWLGERVGATGRVMAVDLETERLGWIERPHVEVARLDLRTDELPAESFDLVHSRMVVQHLEDRPAAVASMVKALKPGGWLFLEDTDSLPLFRSAVSEDFLQDVRAAGYGLMRRSGHEPRGGHFDLRMALDSGLEDVTAEGRTVMVRGGSDQARHYMLWLEFMRPRITAEGLLDDARIDEALREMADPAHHWLSQVLISTFGRKPR